jgi:amidase
MRADDYLAFDATGLADLVHRGEVSPLELAEAAIERITALNPTLNAVVETAYAPALEAARAADRAAPLAGVPFLAKDMNIPVAGLHLTASCRWLASLPAATRDATLAARWRTAGLTILGRTNTPEFAGEFVTEPTWRGATANPWDVTRSPGGSSGGSASAVAAGMVPLAHGTDSGGSIRVPAAACGLVGLKPSRGLVPVGPSQDELAGGLDCEHVLTRTVRDSALLLDLTAGPEAASRAPGVPAGGIYRAALAAPVPPLRIGVTLEAPGGMRPHAEIAAAVERTVALLEAAGHRVSEFAFPPSADVGTPAALIWMTATAEEIDHHRERVGRMPERDELEALTWACIELGRRSTATDYARARRALTLATVEMAGLFDRFDLLLTPTTSGLPVPTGSIDGRTSAFELGRWNADSYGYAPYTEIFNVSGQPAMSLPLGQSGGGLPIGVQFAAPLGQDARLLSMAAWLEREVPWAERLAGLRRRLAAGTSPAS